MEDKEHRIQLYIGNINFRTTERELMEEFSECGKILGVKIPTRNGASCGYGFITIGDKETADKIIQRFDGAELQGRKIYIKSAGRRPKAPNYKDENERYEHRNDDYCYRVERERPLYDERFMREIQYNDRYRQRKDYPGDRFNEAPRMWCARRR
ncbi:RNA-binding protein [Histomonas meleagridis]|uniref:RNA-binding protein n=1 Tax=Histomonas meleagridis TaxID=135588 RepID=UPI003559F64F|nr:RNA-binding protein [Histomonas meleagridis]KAH0802512.1 RNA-binding protein [Histomonas meleagridis]